MNRKYLAIVVAVIIVGAGAGYLHVLNIEINAGSLTHSFEESLQSEDLDWVWFFGFENLEDTKVTISFTMIPQGLFLKI